MQIFFTPNGLTYIAKKTTHKKAGILSIFMTEEKREDIEHDFKTETQYINAQWVGANTNCIIETQNKTQSTYNYVLASLNNSVPYNEVCNAYSKIIYKNIDNGIDIEYFFTEHEGFKYNILAKAGADLSQIKLKYDVNAKTSLAKNGDIIIKTIQGNVIEKAPISYLTENNEQKVKSSFKFENNILSFEINNPTHQAITIDPIVITPGGASPVYDNGADNAGNIYLYAGAGSYMVEKYSSTGLLIWSRSNV